MLMMRCGKRGHELVGEHLHVAGEHGEVDLVFTDQSDLLLLGFALVLFGDGDHEKGNLVEVGSGLVVGVIGNDQRDFALQLADFMAVEQVDQAVVVLRNHDRHLLALAGLGEAPLHVELFGDGREVTGKLGERNIEVGGIELNPHQEPGRVGVGVLVGVQDVAAAFVDEVRDRGHQSFTVGATDEENGAGSHEMYFPP